MALSRVLIIEDDASIREALAECVASFEIAVTTARDGLEGLEQLRAGPIPDAVLLDLRMPRLDGDGVLAALREDPVLRDIAVVAMTGWLEPPRFPVRAFLRKPFDLDELAKILLHLGKENSA
jgi:CheY-like chemotaxis protein